MKKIFILTLILITSNLSNVFSAQQTTQKSSQKITPKEVKMVKMKSVEKQSVFYNPPPSEEYLKGSSYSSTKTSFTISHKSFVEAALGGSTYNNRGLMASNQNPSGRINANTAITIQDSQEKFKALLDLTLGSNSYDDTSSIVSINQGYIELKNVRSQPIQARVRLGLQQTAGTNLAVNSSTPMKNNQGVNGNWFRFVSMPTMAGTGYNPIFILQSKPLTAQGFASSHFLSDGSNYAQPSPYWSYANAGINFMTERYEGLKLGFSYQPTTNNFANPTMDRRGNSMTTSAFQQDMYMKDITSVVLNYLNEWNGVSLNTSISGEFAMIEKNSAATFTRNNLAQYSIGANLSYSGFTLAGSYSNAGKSLLIQNDSNKGNVKDSYTADLGLSYAIGAHQFAISHIQTNFMDNKMNTTVISLNEDFASSSNVKLTGVYEFGFYNFSSSNYLNSGTSTPIAELNGMFLSAGLRASF